MMKKKESYDDCALAADLARTTLLFKPQKNHLLKTNEKKKRIFKCIIWNQRIQNDGYNEQTS